MKLLNLVWSRSEYRRGRGYEARVSRFLVVKSGTPEKASCFVVTTLSPDPVDTSLLQGIVLYNYIDYNMAISVATTRCEHHATVFAANVTVIRIISEETNPV